MYRILPIFIWAVCSSSIIPLAFALPFITHHEKAGLKVEASLQLRPNDSPYVGKPTMTSFMLKQRGDKMISPEVCNCSVAVYDSRQQPIADHLTLLPIALEGHQTGHQSMHTMITFPQPGAYTVALAGQSNDGNFEPFERLCCTNTSNPCYARIVN